MSLAPLKKGFPFFHVVFILPYLCSAFINISRPHCRWQLLDVGERRSLTACGIHLPGLHSLSNAPSTELWLTTTWLDAMDADFVWLLSWPLLALQRITMALKSCRTVRHCTLHWLHELEHAFVIGLNLWGQTWLFLSWIASQQLIKWTLKWLLLSTFMKSKHGKGFCKICCFPHQLPSTKDRRNCLVWRSSFQLFPDCSQLFLLTNKAGWS